MSYKFSDNIQRGILYLAKTEPSFFVEIINLVKPEYFQFPVQGHIFKIIVEYYEKYKSLPKDDFILEEVKTKPLEKLLLCEYEDELYCINKFSSENNYKDREYYLDLIEKFARNEACKKGVEQAILLIKDGKEEQIEEVFREALVKSIRNISYGLDYFPTIEERWDNELNKEQENKLPTPISALDDLLEGGMSTKELAMVVARSGGGKSIFLANQAVTALTEKKKVLYVTLEMSENKIAQRIDSIATLIRQDKLKQPIGQQILSARIATFLREFPGAELIIKEFPTGTATVNTIRALLGQIRLHKGWEPEVIIVDYLELLRPIREIQQEYAAQQKIAQELRGLGMEYNAVIWTATQTNREGARVEIITEAELADSYGKIRECDFAISLNQTEEEYNNGVMRVFVMKSRNSRQHVLFRTGIDYQTLRISQVVEAEEEGQEA